MKQARRAPYHADGYKQQDIAEPLRRLGPSRSPSRHSAPENPPIRYAAPHHASASMRSWLHANSRNSPSNKVTLIAMTNNVPISTDIDSMQYVLTHSGKMLTIKSGARAEDLLL